MTAYASTLPRLRALHIAYVVLGSLALAASARISTPMYPVPTTMQTCALLVLAALFGPRLASAMAVTYLAEGLAGLPVFAHGMGGPAVLVGPTAGYLVAFPFVAWMVGVLHRDAGFVKSVSVMFVAHMVIIAGGVAWLSLSLGVPQALTFGASPFVVGSIVKSVLASVIVALVKR